MFLSEYYLVFPDGDTQEIEHPLSIGTFFDMNGNQLYPPFPTNKMIVYEVCGKRTREECGIIKTYYTVIQLSADELLDYLA